MRCVSRLLAVAGLLLWLAVPSWAANTFGTGSVQGEMERWFGASLHPHILSATDCAPVVPTTSLVLAPFGCRGFVLDDGEALVPVLQDAHSVTLPNVDGTYWLALWRRNAGNPPGGWVSVPGTHYVYQLNSAKPATPTGTLLFAQVTVTTSVITAVSLIGPQGAENSATGSRRLVVTEWPYQAPRDGKGDAAPAINQALADAGTGGYTVYLPCGQYFIQTELVPQSHTIMEGAGECTVIQADPTSSTLKRPIHVLNASYITIRDLTLDCVDGTQVQRQGIVTDGTASFVTIAGTHVVNCGQYGIGIVDTSTTPPFTSGGAGMIVENNVIDMRASPLTNCDTTAGLGIEYFPKGPANFLATPGPLIQGNTVYAGHTLGGIKINNAENARVLGNYVDGGDCPIAEGGILVVGSRDTLIEGNTFINNNNGMALGSVPRDPSVGGNGLSNGALTVKGNTIRGFTNGIFSSDGNSDMLIEGNMLVHGDPSTVSSIYGINFQPRTPAQGGHAFTRLTIRNNHIIGTAAAIFLQADDQVTPVNGFVDTAITGNEISSEDLSGSSAAIDVDLAPYLLIHGNSMVGHRTGVYVGPFSRTDNVIVANNFMRGLNASGTAGEACILVNGDAPQIVNNLCDNAGGAAVYAVTLFTADNPVIGPNTWLGTFSGGEMNMVGDGVVGAPVLLQTCLPDPATHTAPANTAENVIGTQTIPKNYFTINGGFDFKGYGDATGGGGTKTLKAYIGSTQIGTDTVIGAGTTNYAISGRCVLSGSHTSLQCQMSSYDGTTMKTNTRSGLTVDTTAAALVVALKGTKASGADALIGFDWMVCPWR